MPAPSGRWQLGVDRQLCGEQLDKVGARIWAPDVGPNLHSTQSGNTHGAAGPRKAVIQNPRVISANDSKVAV